MMCNVKKNVNNDNTFLIIVNYNERIFPIKM